MQDSQLARITKLVRHIDAGREDGKERGRRAMWTTGFEKAVEGEGGSAVVGFERGRTSGWLGEVVGVCLGVTSMALAGENEGDAAGLEMVGDLVCGVSAWIHAGVRGRLVQYALIVFVPNLRFELSRSNYAKDFIILWLFYLLVSKPFSEILQSFLACLWWLLPSVRPGVVDQLTVSP